MMANKWLALASSSGDLPRWSSAAVLLLARLWSRRFLSLQAGSS